MKKFIYIMLFFLIIIIILSGCKKAKTPVFSPHGNLKLTFLPGEIKNVDSYDVNGAGPDGNTFEELGIKNSTVTVKSLKAGIWTVIVKARNAEGDIIGEGNKQVTVVAKQTVSVEITIPTWTPLPVHQPVRLSML